MEVADSLCNAGELIYVCECVWSANGLEMCQCIPGVVDFELWVGCCGSAGCIQE